MENKGTLIGQLVYEPCIKTGTDYCKIIVASSYFSKTKGKQTDFIPFFLRGQNALNAQKFLGVGAVVHVEYKLRHKSVEKNGSMEYGYEVSVLNFKWYTKGRVSEKQYGINETTNTNEFAAQQQYQQPQNDTYEDISYGVNEMSLDNSQDLGFS